jgi:asparagine synthase (glutamine-hydrolysing)
MTAITGLIGLDGRPYGVADLAGALGILAPLGPDGTGGWAGRAGPLGVALGVVLRHRVPEDDADVQPVILAGGRVVVVADVVLTNRAELCRLLDLPEEGGAGPPGGGGAGGAGLSDAAVVAHAYQRWGDACCARLRGEFAVAVADGRRGGVLLARDHTGARPLHLHRGRGWCGFASTALAVTGFAGVPATPDLDRAAEFLALSMASSRSWVRDVAPVPPATALWLSPAGVRPRRYWEPPDRPARRGSAAEHAERLRDALDAAVRARLRRRGGIGVMLSGGLDSTAVAATVATQVAPAPVRTYTAVPAPGWSGPRTRWDPDESPLVHLLAARHPNLAPAYLDARGAAMIDGDPRLYAAGATPVRNTLNMAWIRRVERRAAHDGVSVLFTGGFGNHAFSDDGRRWLVELLAAGRWRQAWREAGDWSAARGLPLAATVREGLLREAVPPAMLRWRAGRRGQPPPGAVPPEVCALRPDLFAAIAPRWPASLPDLLAAAAAQAETRAAREARGGWRQADPTTDVALLELRAVQPAWARRHRGLDRAAARTAMRGRVPDEIRLRRVRGAQLPDWFDRMRDAYAELCAELAAASGHGPSRTLLDLERLDAAVRDCRPGPVADPPPILRILLPRALAVSRYLRWFDAWAGERAVAGKTGEMPTRNGVERFNTSSADVTR